MRVEINMRPYPEQKPPYSGLFWVNRRIGGLSAMEFYRAETLNEKEYPVGWNCGEVTHFALPEDITITEEKREV